MNMSWNHTVREKYDGMKEELFLAGGQQKIDKQHSKGKLTARERMEALFDGGVFHEFEMYAKSQFQLENVKKKHYLGDGVICGYGYVNGKTVYAVSEDATISGGASGATQVEKYAEH